MFADNLVLLVEDESLLHMVLEAGLGDAGLKLLIKIDAATAMAELDADASRFDAVLTDIRLGKGPTGWDVGRHARKLVPNIPVVYISGDSANDWAANGVTDSVMIPKPFIIEQVANVVATMLKNKRAERR